MSRAGVWLLAAAALPGCAAGKHEAASLVNAVVRFHDADNVAKPAAADAVAKVACTAHDVCAAKELCVAATDPTAKGLLLKAEVQAGIALLEAKKLSPEDEAAKALPVKLDEASQLLDQGHKAMASCDARLLELRRTYGL